MKKTKPTYQQLENKLKSLEKENSFLKLNQKIFDASPAYVVLIGPDGKVLSMNNSILQAIGYTIAEVLGKDYIETFIPVQDRPKLIALFAKHAVVEETAQNINRLLKKDGGTVTVEWHGTPFFDKENNLHAYLGIGIDITEKIETEKLSKKSTIQLETIVNNYPGGSITLIDKDLKIFFTGGTSYSKHNLDPKIFVGKHLKHAFVPEISEINMAYLQKCLNGEICEFIVECEQTYYKNYTYPIVLNNKIEYALLISNDISDLKTQEKDLLKTLQEQNLILKNDPAFIIFKDCKNNILRISETVAKMTGLPMHEIEGKPSKEIYPDMADKYYADDLEVMKSGKPKRGIIEPLTTVDGEQKWLMTDKIPLRNDKGEVAGIILFSSDITDIKKTELALVEAKEKAEESEERFNLAMKATNDGLFDCNLETNEIYYSPGWKKMLGYEDHELPNDFSVWEKVTDPEDLKKSLELQQKLVKNQIGRFVMELKMKHKDGHSVDILSRAEAFFNDSGKAVRMVGTHTDITERKQAEEKLKDNNSRLNLAMQAANMAWWEMDLSSGLVVFEKRKAEMLGYAPEKFHHYKDFMALVHPDDSDKAMNAMRKHLDGSVENYEVEYRILNNSGEYKWVYDIGSIVKKETEGKPLKVTGLVIDISERKKAEAALRLNEDLLNASQHLSKTGGWTWSVEKQSMYWTEETYRIHDINPGEIEPGSREHIKLSSECYRPEDRPMILSAFQRCLKKGQPYDLEFPFTSVKGRQLWVRTSAQPVIENGKTIGVIGNIIDITERKQAEQEIIKAKENAEENKDKFRQITESIEEVFWLRNTDNTEIIYVSPSYEKVWGRTCQSLYDNPHSFIDSVYDEDRPLVIAEYEKYVRGEKSDLEYRITKPDSAIRWIRALTFPVKNDSGEVIRHTGIAEDITDRKLAEIEIEKSKELLSDLNKRMESVREDERADISREIHDQLGQSLTALKIDLMNLRAKIETESTEGTVLGGMIKMVNTISRDVQRISSELRPLMLDDLGLASALEWYCEEFAIRTGLKVELDIEAIQTVSINKDLALYRVAQESLTNIIRHANAGMVQVSLHIIDDNLVLTIQDDGVGISLDKIDSHKSLGLMGMSERVKQYDGKLEIMAPDNNGTIIRASIPIN